ncbi:hypothetical protein RA280_12940 [Cupriavidus sp. CV2]|uniref:hypothetical protein n=1 Tax=Cupriavidus ulmosensis TaxID=3065913 RepID=UPI00296A9EF1|nr:hypothetical protein [Cupriavidus sp. CV2]MDW3682633.1 hypothetical protein [Cupriavidus sp. CV2]
MFPRQPASTLAELSPMLLTDRQSVPSTGERHWKIKRLRILLMCAHQLQEAWDGGCLASVEQVRDLARQELTGEPCIAERKAWGREFLGYQP